MKPSCLIGRCQTGNCRWIDWKTSVGHNVDFTWGISSNSNKRHRALIIGESVSFDPKDQYKSKSLVYFAHSVSNNTWNRVQLTDLHNGNAFNLFSCFWLYEYIVHKRKRKAFLKGEIDIYLNGPIFRRRPKAIQLIVIEVNFRLF